ncbi:MAG: tetratricopeptide repeat protein, partial [Gemmataceae bacterium]|nr:tetratricopeptide repeat protein [Gemmataceae bacterium]
LVLTAGRGSGLYEAATGKLVKMLSSTQDLGHAAFSPDGRRVATHGSRTQVWDVSTDSPRLLFSSRQRPVLVGHVAFSPDSRWLAIAGWDKMAEVWDVEAGHLVHTLRHEGNVVWAGYSRDGRRLLLTDRDGTARVWDALTGEPVTPSLSHGSGVWQGAFSPDGRRVVTVSDDRTARLWDLATAAPLSRPFAHGPGGASAQLSPDGRHVAAYNWTRKVWVSDTQTGRLLCTLDHEAGEEVVRAAFSTDSRLLVTAYREMARAEVEGPIPVAGYRGGVKVWDVAERQVVATLPIEEGWPNSCEISPDGRLVTATVRESGKGENLATVWDLATRQVHSTLPLGEDRPRVASFSRYSRTLLVAAGDTVQVWDLDNRRALQTWKHRAQVTHAVFSPDGRRVASGCQDYQARVWDVTGQEPVATMMTGGFVWSVLFSPDGRRLLTASYDMTARVWDAQTGQPLTPPLRHHSLVDHAAFSADGRRVASCSADGDVRVWDAATGEPLTPFLSHDARLQQVAFTPDGRRVLAVSPWYRGLAWLGETVLTRDAVLLWDVAPDLRPADELVRFARCLAGRRLADNADFLPLGAEELEAGYKDFRAKYPAEFAVSEEQIEAWHWREIKACGQSGQWSSAVRHLDALIAKQPDQGFLHLQRGYAQAALSQWDQALADYSRAFELAPDDFAVVPDLASLQLMRGDTEGYKQTCKLALDRYEKSPDPRQRNSVAWACALAPNGEARRAVRLAGQALAAAPNDANVRNTLGAVLYRAGRYQEAIRHLKKCVEEREGRGTTLDWVFLAMAHYRRGDLPEARKWLEKTARQIEEEARKRPDLGGTGRALRYEQRLNLGLLEWNERLKPQLLLREAKALIEEKKAEPRK